MLYIYRMETITAFNKNNLNEKKITIKGTAENPLFKSNDIAEILDFDNIRQSLRKYDDTEKEYLEDTDSSGRIQPMTFLTEKGFYRLLNYKAKKPIAEQFQKFVYELIRELYAKIEKQNKLNEKQKQTEKQEIKLKEDSGVLEREKILLNQYASIGSIIYIIKVKTFENGHYIVKIGESRRGIAHRYNQHKTKYDECLLLDCFTVDKSKDLESFLHNHENIRGSKVTNLKGHEREYELFLIGQNLTYKTLLDIINKNIKYYNINNMEKVMEKEKKMEKKTILDYDTETEYDMETESEMETKNETKNNQNDNNNNQLIQELIKTIKQLSETVKHLSSKIDNQEIMIQEILNNQNAKETKTVTGFNQQLPHLGPRLQKINPETKHLVKVYESVTEAMNEDKNIKRPSIAKAVEENTIYNGFRWQLVERNLDPKIIYSLEPTKETVVKNIGYIAKLNINQTEILNVYLDRKTAAKLNGFESASALDNPVKNRSIIKNYYYVLYNDCDLDLINSFEEKHGKLLLYKNGLGQYDLEYQFVKEFACKYDCLRELKMSDKTLEKLLEKKVPHNGFYYKLLDSKIVI